jgi:PIN domain nuclease of toxin-antitoxin system
VTTLDAQAVVAFLMAEPAAPEVRDLLRDAPVISAMNWSEVVDNLIRIKGKSVAEVTQQLDLLVAGGLKVIAVDESIGRTSGRLRARHYHRRERPVSYADCVALATAQALGAPLATSDPALAATAVAIGVPLVPLPDSQGQRPTV